MSRIGKLAIAIPEKVVVSHQSENLIHVKGNFGELSQEYPTDLLTVEITGSKILVTLKETNNRKARQFQGLYRTLINNMILGVSERFEKS